MTRLITLLTLILFFAVFSSCTKPGCGPGMDLVGNWVTRAQFNGVPRSGAASFVIDTLAYVGMGIEGTNYLNDLWQYNATGNYWVQRANFPGDGRTAATAFSIGNKGYFGTGYNGQNNLNDFWAYDPSMNTWTRKADFIGSARSNAVGFAINNKGYITTGNDGNDLNDFYEYDTTFSSWKKDADMPGMKRSGAVAFVYNSKAYICTGSLNGVDSIVNDMWAFDPLTASWSAKRSITKVSTDTYDDSYGTTLIVRDNAVAFVMGDYAYLCTGQNGSMLKTVWEYDFATDLWDQKQPWEGVERTSATGFSVNGRGFVGWGRNTKNYFADIREFFPFQTYNAND